MKEGFVKKGQVFKSCDFIRKKAKLEIFSVGKMNLRRKQMIQNERKQN